MTALPLWLNLSILFVSAILAYWNVAWLKKRHPKLNIKSALKQAPHLYIILLLLLGLLGFHFLGQQDPQIAWSFPLWLEFYYTALTWGLVLGGFAFLFAFGIYLSFLEQHPERWKLVLASLMLIGTVEFNQWKFTRPIGPQIKAIEEGGFVLQATGVSCAAASAANVMRSLGKTGTTELEMAEILGTTDRGTSTAQIIYGMRKLGLNCEKLMLEEGLPEFPAFLFVDNPIAGPESHAVALLGFKEGQLQLLDPAQGEQLLSEQNLRKFWPGRALSCHPE